MPPASNAMIIDKVSDQQASIAVLQEQVTRLREATDGNSQALHGHGNYIGLVSEVSNLSRSMDTLVAGMDEIRKSILAIGEKDPCKTCEIDRIVDDVKEIKKKGAEFPNILWLIRNKPKQSIPIIIAVVVGISAIGHLEFEPVFVALMSTVGFSPLVISSILKVFGK
jgi:hypothetical protein